VLGTGRRGREPWLARCLLLPARTKSLGDAAACCERRGLTSLVVLYIRLAPEWDGDRAASCCRPATTFGRLHRSAAQVKSLFRALLQPASSFDYEGDGSGWAASCGCRRRSSSEEVGRDRDSTAFLQLRGGLLIRIN
jgi:hypothetical protein